MSAAAATTSKSSPLSAENGQSAKDARNLTKEERRQLMPVTTELFDAAREVMGMPESIDAEENGYALRWQK